MCSELVGIRFHEFVGITVFAGLGLCEQWVGVT